MWKCSSEDWRRRRRWKKYPARLWDEDQNRNQPIINIYFYRSSDITRTRLSISLSSLLRLSLFDSLLLSPTTSNRAWLQASDHRNLTHWTTLDSKQLNNIYFKIFYVIYKFGFARFSSSSNITKTQISSNYTAENY